MMTTTVLPLPPDLAESDTLRPLAEQASAWVTHFVADLPVPVTVEWYRFSNGPEGDLVGVRVSDEFATAHGVLSPFRPTRPDDYKARVAKVFNVMLQSSVKEQMRRVRQLPPPPDGE